MSMEPGANTTDRRLAVIGIAGRFPEADDVDAFWKNLEQGRESVRRIHPDVVAASGFDLALTRKPNYVNVAGRLDAIDMFDPAFFSMSTREAELREPQHRLLLECCYQALQNAGYVPSRYAGAISLYAAIGKSAYLYKNLLARQELVDTLGVHALFLSNDKDFASTFVSYKLHLTGASMTVSSGCSSSLVAVHLAIQNLLNHESDIALAGGASINWNQDFGYHYEEGGIHPADGHVRPFDARAQGTIGGSGAGIVVLKRLADAIASGDHIHGVIRGCAVNNDGKDKIGYAAPSVSGQASVIREALRRAQVEPRSISYVETHGTGTILGDPIEMQALREAYGDDAGGGSCAVGSVKSNIGHLDAAAGVAGLIKVVLSMQHRKKPSSLNFERLNPEIDLEGGPFHVNDRLTSWHGPQPLRAGVSSLGIGGTNVHLIVEAAPARADLDERRSDDAQLLVLSARNRVAMEAGQRALIAFLQAHPDVNLADCAFTLQEGREHFPWRVAVTARNAGEAAARLGGAAARETSDVGKSDLVLLFTDAPPEAEQWAARCRQLYRDDTLFRQAAQEACLLGERLFDVPLRDDFEGKLQQSRDPELVARLRTLVVGYAHGTLLLSHGVRAIAHLGAGVGEHVAAYFARTLSLEEALKRAAAMGRSASTGDELERSIERQIQRGARIFVQVGPDDFLRNVIATRYPAPGRAAVVTVGTQESFCEVLGELWSHGCAVDFRGLHAEQRRYRVPLPGYYFDRKRCWVDPPSARGAALERPTAADHAEPAVGVPSNTRPVAPKVDTEATMRDIWRTCFNLDDIDADADFFQLGGDSLLATKLVARIKERFDCSLSIRQFMDEPTFSGVLRAVAEPPRGGELQERVAERF